MDHNKVPKFAILTCHFVYILVVLGYTYSVLLMTHNKSLIAKGESCSIIMTFQCCRKRKNLIPHYWYIRRKVPVKRKCEARIASLIQLVWYCSCDVHGYSVVALLAVKTY